MTKRGSTRNITIPVRAGPRARARSSHARRRDGSSNVHGLHIFYDAEVERRTWGGLAITNALDEDPPVIAQFDQRFSSQGNPANAYDVYGRRYLLSFAYRL
jgi:hypothetical protein